MKKIKMASGVVLFIALAVIAAAGPQMPDWAAPVLKSLGCQPAMVMDIDGDTVVTGIATDVDKLKAHDFTVFPGTAHRVKISRIKDGLYKVVVDNLHKDGRNQTKELKLP